METDMATASLICSEQVIFIVKSMLPYLHVHIHHTGSRTAQVHCLVHLFYFAFSELSPLIVYSQQMILQSEQDNKQYIKIK